MQVCGLEDTLGDLLMDNFKGVFIAYVICLALMLSSSLSVLL